MINLVSNEIALPALANFIYTNQCPLSLARDKIKLVKARKEWEPHVTTKFSFGNAPEIPGCHASYLKLLAVATALILYNEITKPTL